QAEAVAEPLDRRAGHEDGALERAARFLSFQPRCRGAQDAAARLLLRLDEDERACPVRGLRAAGREERRLLVAGDAADRQRGAEELALAEVGAGRADLRQDVARNREQV